MSERIFKVVDKDGDVYWTDDAAEIIPSFGRVVSVIQYELMDELDITDQVNGDYFDQ
jgi:predicted transcriptional regulator